MIFAGFAVRLVLTKFRIRSTGREKQFPARASFMPSVRKRSVVALTPSLVMPSAGTSCARFNPNPKHRKEESTEHGMNWTP